MEGPLPISRIADLLGLYYLMAMLRLPLKKPPVRLLFGTAHNGIKSHTFTESLSLIIRHGLIIRLYRVSFVYTRHDSIHDSNHQSPLQRHWCYCHRYRRRWAYNDCRTAEATFDLTPTPRSKHRKIGRPRKKGVNIKCSLRDHLIPTT